MSSVTRVKIAVMYIYWLYQLHIFRR